LLARMNDLIALVKKLEKDIYNQHGDIRRLQSLIENCAGCWGLFVKFTRVNTHETMKLLDQMMFISPGFLSTRLILSSFYNSFNFWQRAILKRRYVHANNDINST
jgi:hypothetical protein